MLLVSANTRVRGKGRQGQGAGPGGTGPWKPYAGQKRNKKGEGRGGGKEGGGHDVSNDVWYLVFAAASDILPRMFLGPALCPALSFFPLVALAALGDNLLLTLVRSARKPRSD